MCSLYYGVLLIYFLAEDFTGIKRALLSPGPDLVVCDEGHRIKNEKAGIAAALSAVETKLVFCNSLILI